MARSQLDRRRFLARLGVLGAVAATNTAFPGLAQAATQVPGRDSLLGSVSELLAELARDTLNGLAAFVVPGSDAYSRAQGTPQPDGGAIQARTPDFLIESLDNFVPFPDQLGNPIATALANGLGDVPIALPDLPLLPGGLLTRLDDAVRYQLRNDETLPLSVIIALLLNNVAVQVNPLAVNGLFLSPFSRLSFSNKAAVFQRLEGPDQQLVAAIDRELPEPLRGTASGMLQFIAGALLEFSAFGTYCEWSTFDPDRLNVSKPPLGWQLASYDPGSIEGWDEFKGYYQGRQKVSPV